MAPLVQVQAATLPDIPRRLQQAFCKNRSRLEQAQIWEYLLWIRDVEKEVNQSKVAQFVHTYQWKTKTAPMLKDEPVDFSTITIFRVLNIPHNGVALEALPELQKSEADDIFDYKFRWGKDVKWNYEAARLHWREWFDFVNTYLLFRPEDHRMEQKYIVAAIRTWEGQAVQWAQVVQNRMIEEIQSRKGGATPKIYLFSAFYISCLCEGRKDEATTPATTPQRISPVQPKSPDSPSLADLEVQLARTNVRVRELEVQLSEKKDKLVEVQEKSASYLQQINELLRDKFSDHRKIAELQAQNAQMKLQIEELRRIQPREKEVTKGKELVRPMMIDTATNTEGRKVTPPTSMVIVPHEQNVPISSRLPVDVCMKLWDVEQKYVPNFNLHHWYVFKRDLFLTMVGLELGAHITKEQFQELWDLSLKCLVENLFTEILARKHLILLDPFAAYVVLGDVGARIYLYYAECEEQLHMRRVEGRRVEVREVDWDDYDTQMSKDFYEQNRETRDRWKKSLDELLPIVKHEDYLARILGYHLKRVYRATSIEDFTGSHYLYARDRAIERMERYIHAVEVRKAPVFSVQVQVQFEVAPPGYVSKFTKTVIIPEGGALEDQRFLGNYEELFDDVQEKPVPTWTALAWILQDYGLSRTEQMAADLVYKQISGPWSFDPPPVVQVHPQYCPCARRHKWSPTSTLASVEYNWPQIQGAPGFNTPAQCREAYQRFFDEHKTHKDPVCFRAAIFCAALADWCHKWSFAINVNVHNESKQEFLMLLKLQYRPSRWIRVVEAMALTHFIEGVHISLINEFPFTRAGPFERFLKWQKRNNPQAVAQDEDLQRAVLRLEAKEARHRGSGSQDLLDVDSGHETEGSVKRLRVGRDANRGRRYDIVVHLLWYRHS